MTSSSFSWRQRTQVAVSGKRERQAEWWSFLENILPNILSSWWRVEASKQAAVIGEAGSPS
jgi:hypothetical protein